MKSLDSQSEVVPNRGANRIATVSVVIPAFNAAEFLPETIQSVLRQTKPPLEVIVIDDGSEDGTPEVMRDFLGRVTYLRKPREGPAAARNFGIQHAHGEWIALLDADDLWLPERLERQLAVASRSGADLVFCDAATLAGGDTPSTTRFTQYRLKNRFETEAPNGVLRNPFKLLFAAGCYILPSTVLVRKKTLLEAGLFDEKFYCNEDMDLWMRLALQCRFAVVNEPLVLRRIHGKNISDDPWAVVTGELKVCESLERRRPSTVNADWPALLRKKKADLYRQKASLHLLRNELAHARKSWADSLRLSIAPVIALYWIISFLPSRWVMALWNWKAKGLGDGRAKTPAISARGNP